MLVLVAIQTSTHQMQGDVLESVCLSFASWTQCSRCEGSSI